MADGLCHRLLDGDRVTWTIIRILLLAWAALLFAVPAKADQLDRALRRMCGKRGQPIAGLVRAEAHRYLLHPVLLAKLIAAESRCRSDARGALGELGLGQILPRGSAAVPGLDLLDPATNVRLTAAHLARLEVLCGSIAGALSVYAGHRLCRPTRYSRRVLSMLEDQP